MKQVSSFLIFLFILFAPHFLFARPILTEDAPTLGRLGFEAKSSLSFRRDRFGSPKETYDTVAFPLQLTLGLHRMVDAGFILDYVSHKIESTNSTFKGSASGEFSAFLKISPDKRFGLLGIWDGHHDEDRQDLPVGRGDNLNLTLLWSPTTSWPLHFNAGYVWRGSYDSRFGVKNQPTQKVEPGNIFETKAALEVPMGNNFNFLLESAFYNVDSTAINSTKMDKTAGDAWDAFGGVTWEWAGLFLGVEAGFGLLDESHSSFDIERGAGDWMGKFSIAYRILSRKTEE